MRTEHLPHAHTAFLDRALPLLQSDPRIVGIAAAGSFVSGRLDEFSDLDLVIAVEPESTAAVSAERHQIASGLGSLVAAFTGEHVGEPRLLICLYDGEDEHPPLHVDLKFISLDDAVARVEEPTVLWERDSRLSAALEAEEAHYPMPNLGWIEDRFWVWIHYATTRIARGELFEAVDCLGFLRVEVLGPLALFEAGAQPTGVRRIETEAPSRVTQLQDTVPAYDPDSCIRALCATAELYRSLRHSVGSGLVASNQAAENTALSYLAEIAAR